MRQLLSGLGVLILIGGLILTFGGSGFAATAAGIACILGGGAMAYSFSKDSEGDGDTDATASGDGGDDKGSSGDSGGDSGGGGDGGGD